MVDNGFFDETTEQSQAKAAIVSKYFAAWARVIMPTAKKGPNRIAYIDLFAGPGRYKDGTTSTPLLVLQHALNDPSMRDMLVTLFNDADSQNSGLLAKEIAKLPGINTLRYPPDIRNEVVGSDIVQMFERVTLVPTLFFVDPWGYKGLSLDLITSVLKDWGCDCIFFFNYNRISMGIPNRLVDQHMDALFGKVRAEKLRAMLAGLSGEQRELTIVEELAEALKDKGGHYVLPFRFRNSKGERTSHHLIFVTKHFKGYEIMKDVMAKESTSADQGVASFEYSPADVRQPLLFELTRPLDELGDALTNTFAGESLTVQSIYERHSVGRRFIKKNYKAALLKLEKQGRITATPVKRRKDTMADTVIIEFPRTSAVRHG